MKKLFALLLAALMVFSMTACGETTEPPVTTTAPTTEATEPTPMGTLYVAFGATLELTYDANGNALTMEGTNELGKTLAAAKQDQVGKGCVFVLRAVFRYASDNQLLGDTKSMVIRVGAGEKLPSEDFLDTISTDCQYLADEECTGVRMAPLTCDKLDEQGNLTYNTALSLACRFMDALEEDVISDGSITEGVYTFTYDSISVTVDAFTGLVT